MSSRRAAVFMDAGRSLEDSIERIKLIESLGYESAWSSHIAGRDPCTSSTGGRPRRIAFGTGVTPIFVRHPALLAQEAATLDQLSGGRFNLGIGTSHTVTVEGWYGQTLDHPVSRMREYTTILRQLFTTGASNLDGKHYTSHFAFMGLRG
jgi:alkanesulfonate monooxygenase SsuD/methylene tetrahydromethanopterin reductase-like flavin-dependent oxidoreductase (luciferase family)